MFIYGFSKFWTIIGWNWCKNSTFLTIQKQKKYALYKYWLQKHVYTWCQSIVVFRKIFSLHLLMNLVNLKLLYLADAFSLALIQDSSSLLFED